MWRLTVVLLLALSCSRAAHAAEAERWTGATPDETILLARDAISAGAPGALARLALIATLREEATGGLADTSLAAVAAGDGPVAPDARWLARALAPEPSETRLERDDDGGGPVGLVRTLVVMGPYEDSGGGLDRREGPERPDFRFASADDSWGVYAVRPQRSVVEQVTARGLPLDVYVTPRGESCSYLATVLTFATKQSVIVNLASTGSFRLLIDGREAARDERVHAGAFFDRASVRIDGDAGDHRVIVKTCSGALGDEGRVRLRLSDPKGRDLRLKTSSELTRLDAAEGRSEITRLSSSLEKALALIDDTSSNEMLAAAVIAVLAGADDLRSRAAPGWLDRVVADSPDADALALAGFVAPFGAQKSGWLGLAAARDDARARSFARRALVRARLETGAVDLAKDTAAPLDKAEDADARILRAEVLASLGAQGLSIRARLTIEALVDELGSRAPTRALRVLLQLDPTPARRLAAHRALAERAPGALGPAFVAAHEMLGSAELLPVAKRVLAAQPSADEMTAIAAMVFALGAHRAAADQYRLIADLSPNHLPAFVGLARALSLTSSGSEAHLLALDRALELDPSNAALKAQLEFRLGASKRAPVAGDDARWLVAPEVFLARAVERTRDASSEGISARELHWRRVVRMHPDKRVSELIHYAREIVVVPRTENERYEDIPGGWGSELLLARVHRRDGAILSPDERDDAGPTVRWPKLERGDVVEIAVRSWTAPVGRRGDPPFYFVDYVGSVDTEPVLYNEVVIDAPPGSPLAWDVIGAAPDETTTEQLGGRQITRLIWHDPPTLPDEPWSPPASELLPLVVGSAYPGWGSFLDWYRGAVEGFTTPDEQIKRLARELTEGKTSREEKVAALFAFVADDIRYVNFRSGEWWLPNRPQDLLAHRQGDCDDKAMLLISLLRAVGIEAKEVLIQTRMTRQPRVMQSEKAAVPMFDHGIIWLPDEVGGGGRFLDATSPQSRMGALPAMDAGAMALLVEDGARLIQTPLGTSADHGVAAEWTLTLDASGGGTLRAVERHLGDPAFYLRTHLGREDTRAQWVEQNLLAGWFAGLDLAPAVGFVPDLPGGAAEVRFDATASALARREGDDLVVTVAPPTPITTILAPLAKRSLDVDLPPSVAPHHKSHVIEVIAPAGYRFAALPPDAEVAAAPYGSASARFSLAKDGRRATLQRSVALERARIPAADYPSWRRFLQDVDALLLRGFRLVPDVRAR